jgi:formate dehydrogenase major subunit
VVGYRFVMATSAHRRADPWPHRRHRHRPLDRLTEPLVRDGGVLRPASWDEALERAASGFASVRTEGERSIGVFSCSKSTNEMNFIAQKLARVAFGTNNIDSCNRT